MIKYANVHTFYYFRHGLPCRHIPMTLCTFFVCRSPIKNCKFVLHVVCKDFEITVERGGANSGEHVLLIFEFRLNTPFTMFRGTPVKNHRYVVYGFYG